MLTHFIVSLIAVIAFAIFEYTHNKATYSIKTAWIKYLAGLALGTFGFPYLLKWDIFQYVLQATFVVAFLFFFWIIVQKLKIKGVPGQPLKAVILVLAVAGFASCQPYGDKVDGNPCPGTDCAFRPVTADDREAATKGWITIDSAHAGNPLVCPVMVKVEASWPQKWAIAKHDGSAAIAIILWVLAGGCLVLSFLGTIWAKGLSWIVGFACFAIVLCWFGASYVDWAFTKEIEVTKQLFDTPGALKAYWDANLFK